MRFVGFLIAVAGMRSPVGDTLFLKQKALDRFRFATRPELPRPRGPVSIVTSPLGTVQFALGSEEAPERVAQVTTALQVAGGLLENAIRFDATVRVRVNHGGYCKAGGACAKDHRETVLGACGAAEKKEALPNSDAIVYPYALLHQSLGAREVDFDMDMYIKASDQFAYPGDYGRKSSSSHWDSIWTILHELCHGLGIGSKLINDIPYFNYVGPFFEYTTNATHIAVLFTKSLFDTYVHPNDPSKSFPATSTFPLRGSSPSSFLARLHHLTGFDDLRTLRLQKNSIHFNTTRGTKVLLHTSHFEGDASLSHLSLDYLESLNYLMPPSPTTFDRFLEETEMNQAWATAPLGDAILEILETLNYTRNPSPRRERSQIALYKEMCHYNKLV